jgi:hypothetical protein
LDSFFASKRNLDFSQDRLWTTTCEIRQHDKKNRFGAVFFVAVCAGNLPFGAVRKTALGIFQFFFLPVVPSHREKGKKLKQRDCCFCFSG